MVDTWQRGCAAVTLASGYAEMDPCSIHTGDSYMGLCPKQEFQEKSEFKCKVIPHWLMCAQGAKGALEQSYPLAVCSGSFRTTLANGASLRMPSGWGCIWQLQTCHLSPLLGDEQWHSHGFACGHQICDFPTFLCLPLDERHEMIRILKLNSFVPLLVKKKARVNCFHFP